jgi:hypothetical protein
VVCSKTISDYPKPFKTIIIVQTAAVGDDMTGKISTGRLVLRGRCLFTTFKGEVIVDEREQIRILAINSPRPDNAEKTTNEVINDLDITVAGTIS